MDINYFVGFSEKKIHVLETVVKISFFVFESILFGFPVNSLQLIPRKVAPYVEPFAQEAIFPLADA